MSNNLIYHLCRREDWREALENKVFEGKGDDIRDGFLHFSTGDQVAESAARHRSGMPDLLLIGVNPDDLGESLKWESSRGGQLFPHLYGALTTTDVVRVEELLLNEDGYHVFPDDIAPYTADQ